VNFRFEFTAIDDIKSFTRLILQAKIRCFGGLRAMISRPNKGITSAVIAVIVVVIIVIAAVAIYYVSTTTSPSTTTTTTTTTPTTTTTIPTTTTSSSGISGSITLAVEPGYDDAALKQVAADYEASHPGTTINIADVGYPAVDTDYVTAFSAHQDIYDVVYFSNAGQLAPFDQWLVPLQSYMTNTAYFPSTYNFSDIIPTTYAAYQINGNLLGLPIQADAMLMFYQPSYFTSATNQQEFMTEYGYPLPNPGTSTINASQLVDIANFFTNAHGSKYGILFNADPDDDDMLQTFSQLVAGTRLSDTSQFGPVNPTYGVLYSSTGQLLMNSSAYIPLLSDMSQLVKDTEAPFSGTFGDSVNYFQVNGTSPILISFSYPMGYLNDTNGAYGTGWAIAPKEVGGTAVLGGIGLGIYNGTKNLPLALSFVAYATSSTEDLNYWKLDSLAPPRYSDITTVEQSGFPSAILNTFYSNLATAVQIEANEPYETTLGSSFVATMPYLVSGSISASTAAALIETSAVNAGATPYP
jgi:ABC-type glycerol-3-phosphate transport system substrate-binding protein